MSTCPSCGRAVEPDFRLCPYCGAELATASTPAREERKVVTVLFCDLVVHRDPHEFYGAAAQAGADSVLVADLPVAEAPPIVEIARAHGIAPVLIAPPNAD